MPAIDRRAATLMALLARLAGLAGNATAEDATDPAPRTPPAGALPRRGEDVVMLVYPGVTVLDLVGPRCMFAAVQGARVHAVARLTSPVTSDTGFVLTPTATFADSPADLAVLFASGAPTAR